MCIRDSGHTCQLGEGHSQRSHTCVLTVGDNNTVGERLDTTDTLEASAGGHRLLHDGVPVSYTHLIIPITVAITRVRRVIKSVCPIPLSNIPP